MYLLKPSLIILVYLFISLTFSKLLQVYSLFRHGARYPSSSFYDGNQSRPLWYQLTAVGMRQHQKIGELIRKQYIQDLQFLSKNYNQNQIQVFSTSTNRTQVSSISFMYGLYPAGTGPKISYVNRNYHLPPYSNKTDSQEQNFALPNGHQQIKTKVNEHIILSDCPNYEKFQSENFNKMKESVNEMNITYSPFMKKMSTLFNFKIDADSLYNMVNVYQVASVNRFLGRRLPQNFTQSDYQNVKHLANWYYYVAMSGNNSFMANTQKMKKIIEEFDLRTQLKQQYAKKWTFLFGHDTDILSFHLALNISNETCTEQLYRKGSTKSHQCQQGGNQFTSNVIIELHSQSNNQYFVKVRANGKYVQICGNKNMQCNLFEFKTLLRKSISHLGIDQICGKHIQQTDKPLHQQNIISIM